MTATSTRTTTPTTTATATASGTVASTPTTTATATPNSGSGSNDEIDSATVIEGLPYGSSQDTTGATVASDDPNMGSGNGVNSNTVWYRFVAPSSGAVRADTSGSSYDTVLAAFRGSRGSLTWLAANDDTGTVLQSEIVFQVEAGVTYYLEVAEWGNEGAGGQLHLRVELGTSTTTFATSTRVPVSTWTPIPAGTPIVNGSRAAAPSNDDIASAAVVGSLPFTTTLDTTGATWASDDPDMGAGTGKNSHTVWYRFTAATGGGVLAHTRESNYDTVLAVFTGSRGSLRLVASNDDASGDLTQSEVRFATQAGTSYYLEVAQYGMTGGGRLRLSLSAWDGPLAATATVTGTPSTLAATPMSIPTVTRSSAPASRGERYFDQTRFRVNEDRFWDYFNKRGGIRTFGYPISWEFPFLGFEVQLFQRGIMQLMPDGSVATMNLLDEGLMPYNRINFSTFPKPERELIEMAPSPLQPGYGEKAIAFLQSHVPDRWEGMEVNFLKTFLSTVRYEDAFPEGNGEPALVPLLNLELWGLPTSRAVRDPENDSFVYQRFQRGIMHYDASTGLTQGLLLADYLKGIMTGENLPPDLDAQAQGSRFYRQHDPSKPGYLARPWELPGTNLSGAFEQ